MREQDGLVRIKKMRENKEIDILIEGANVGLARNLALEKFLRIHKDDLS